MKRHDPNHLNLGMRGGGRPTEAEIRAARAFDVYSVNVYDYEVPADRVRQISELTGKPIVIGEFHFGAPGRGLAASLVQVRDQEQRGVAYRYYVEQAYAQPELIGTHYFQWADQPCTGRFDGESYNIGLVDVTDRPYPDLVKALVGDPPAAAADPRRRAEAGRGASGGELRRGSGLERGVIPLGTSREALRETTVTAATGAWLSACATSPGGSGGPRRWTARASSSAPASAWPCSGPNGAGKTTLVRCLSGRVRPDSGSMELLGRPLLPRSGREGLGFVPQELALYPDLTARENLGAFGRFHGLRGRELREAVERALEWTGLSDRADELTKTFSGGMKRRVNIACGVLHRPTVLLLDEPTVGVDPQSRERIFVMLDELRDQGTSILLTTHQLDEAEQRSDRIVIIDHGRVIAEGTLPKLIESTVGVNRRVTFKLAAAAPELEGLRRRRRLPRARRGGRGRGPRSAEAPRPDPGGRRAGARRRREGPVAPLGLHPPHRTGAARMIWTVVRVGLLRMWHGRTELLLTFVVPIAFFTIFAFIFDEQIGLGKSPKVNLALVDEDHTELSRRLLAGLAEQETLRVTRHRGGREHWPSTPGSRPGSSSSPADCPWRSWCPPGGQRRSPPAKGTPPRIRILADSSDPVATQVVSALVQQLAGRILAEQAREMVRDALLSGAALDEGGRTLADAPRGAVAQSASPARWRSTSRTCSRPTRRTRWSPCTPRASR